MVSALEIDQIVEQFRDSHPSIDVNLFRDFADFLVRRIAIPKPEKRVWSPDGGE
jgi:hypothetical protein